MGRINSESTLVSKRITARHPKKMSAAGADRTGAHPANLPPPLGKTPGDTGTDAGRGPLSQQELLENLSHFFFHRPTVFSSAHAKACFNRFVDISHSQACHITMPPST